jgi:soluble lytic murein transglycosylase
MRTTPWFGITACLFLILGARETLLADAGAAPRILSTNEVSLARSAIKDAQNKRWSAARKTAAQVSDPLPSMAVEWLYLKHRKSGANSFKIRSFIDSHNNWPSLVQLRHRAEKALPDKEPAHSVIAWFDRYPPLSGKGKWRYGEALIGNGEVARGEALIREAWTDHDFDSADEKSFLKAHRSRLTATDHIARLDRQLWDNRRTAARRQIGRVDKAHARLAKARLALMTRAAGVDAAIKRVPTALRSDPGLVYERVRWRRRAGLDSGAIDLLSNPPADLGRPKKWWLERHILARDALADGSISLAYRLAANHGQTSPAGIAEAEWLAGWIALRFLGDAMVAVRHFETMHDVVGMPISIARGAYWSGRASAAAGLPEKSKLWYQSAARQQTAYYGQLAMLELGRDTLALPRPPMANPTLVQNFESREMVRLARLFGELAETDLMMVVVGHLLKQAKLPAERVLIASLGLDYNLPKVAIRAAKQISRTGLTVTDAAYPVPTALAAAPVRSSMPDLAIVLGLARQESELDTRAISRAGARGLMQLMPATARMVARQVGVPYERARLTGDDAYNVQLGTRYLSGLFKDYQGAQILAYAAYNAGPGRVRQWIRKNGDPRDAGVDAIDWVELIPFSETRNYVQRVLEGAQVYRHLLADPNRPPQLHIADDMIGAAPQLARR